MWVVVLDKEWEGEGCWGGRGGGGVDCLRGRGIKRMGKWQSEVSGLVSGREERRKR